MKQGQKIDLGMTGLDDLFMTDQQRAEKNLPKIYDIPLDQIDSFPDHPFKVRDDEDMQQLVQSITENGIITPIIVRKKDDGRYEIVAGHRRTRACQLAGLNSVRAEIRDMSRDEAIIMMVDSNLQRSVILPSEKALAYKMRLEAMKRLPGRPSKNNSAPVGQNYEGKTSREVIAESSPDSQAQIQRYIRLTELIPELVELVDEGRMGMRPAVELSYLPKDEQQMLAAAIEYTDATPSHDQARRLRSFSKDGNLRPYMIEEVMEEEKPNQREKISLRYADARKFIPEEVPYNRIQEYIMKVLEDHYKRLKHRSDRDSR